MRLLLPAALLIVGGGMFAFAYAAAKPALFIMILSGGALAFFRYCLIAAARRDLGRTPIVLALAFPAAAWLLPNVWLLYAMMLGTVPLLARRAGDVAPTYLFALLLLPGLDQTISAGSLKLFEFGVHDALAIGAALRLRGFRDRARIRFGLDAPFLGVLLLFVTATARDTSVTNFFRVLVNSAFDFALPYYIVSRGIRTAEDARRCMMYLACAATVLAAILLYEAKTSWPMYNMLYNKYGVMMQIMVKSRGGVLRAGGPFLESTSMAMVLVSCILAAFLSRPAFRSRFHYFAALVVLLAGLTAPQSRGAWIGLLIGLTVADLYRGRVAATARRTSLIVAVLAILVILAPMSPYLSDTMGFSAGSADTVDYRQRLFTRGMEEFWKSPIVGYSSPQILVHLSDLRQGEGIVDFVNTYIFVALVSGIVGIAIFVGAFLVYLARLWRGRRRSPAAEFDTVSAFAFAGLTMPMEMLIFTSFGGRPAVFVFMLFGFGAAIVEMQNRQVRRRPSPAYTSGTITRLAA